MANFNLTKMAVDMYCPGNVVQQDDAGLPSLLVWIPAFKLSDVLNTTDDSVHPAFIVNGRQIPGFYYSKYENVVYNGKAYSLPAEDPKSMISLETARECCEAKGYGWHLSTAAEWAAIALWCKKNGFLPYGNNNYGKDSRETDNKAIATYKNSDGTTSRVATGTGPLTWSHDGTTSGVWDMNGNVWEWQGGLRVVWGELQILADNDAADPDNPQNATSVCWKAINAADGSLVEPECSASGPAVLTGSTVRLDYVSDAWTYTNNITSAADNTRNCLLWKAVCAASISDAAKIRLRSLALLPDEGSSAGEYESDKLWFNNGSAGYYVCRGGSGSPGEAAGVFSVTGNSSSYAGNGIGFRAAYIPNL